VYNESRKIINQGSGFFISPNLILSSRHVFWKPEMRNAYFAKVSTYSKAPVDLNIVSVIIDDTDSDLIILHVDGQCTLRLLNALGVSTNFLPLSTEEILEGEDIFVISSPLGLPGVTSTGK
jgi:hypothetical protein